MEPKLRASAYLEHVHEGGCRVGDVLGQGPFPLPLLLCGLPLGKLALELQTAVLQRALHGSNHLFDIVPCSTVQQLVAGSSWWLHA